jgi:membrane protease YdiL (CAAX protease family)
MHQLLTLRYKWYFWAFAIGMPLLIGGVFQLTKILLSDHTLDGSVPFYAFFMIIFSSILFGGLEEIGWRGFLQERLMNGQSIILIATFIGLIWGLWHSPLFFIEGVSHYAFDFLPFLLGAILFSTFPTWLYAKTRNLILPILFHASINASTTIGLRLVFKHSILNYTLILLFIALGYALLYRSQSPLESTAG